MKENSSVDLQFVDIFRKQIFENEVMLSPPTKLTCKSPVIKKLHLLEPSCLQSYQGKKNKYSTGCLGGGGC